jgi:hypothetical protein
MDTFSVVDKGSHCEIHQGDAIAADYVANRRIAELFASAPELLGQCKRMLSLVQEFDRALGRSPGLFFDVMAAIRKAEGRDTPCQPTVE